MTEFALPQRHLLKEEFTTPFPYVERALETADGFAAAVATVEERNLRCGGDLLAEQIRSPEIGGRVPMGVGRACATDGRVRLGPA